MKILTIGRKGSDVVINDDSVSRQQAEITVTHDGKYYLVDCGSSNGTEIRSGNTWKQVKQEFVGAEDEVRFAGRFKMTVHELLAKCPA